MSQLVHALSEETQNFLKAWRNKNLKLIDPFNQEVVASDLFTSYMPACDGTVTMFQKDGKSLRMKIESDIIRIKGGKDDNWIMWFFIRK